MLHIVNKSSFERNALQSCIDSIDDKSVIILIEDGVISATDNLHSPMLASLIKQSRVYALRADIEARGILAKVTDGVQLVDYAGFVDLVVEHHTSVSWV